ncbi:TetR/AcrR family transcriptional regulator [Actinokineospora auranticolor]|uniref:AcrR family transcriptional regulator n=1 Tax=Actinokineospora auranticolor TaxID=155976 RepID=A0A2S6GZI0_9PSEU|nr:TetR/AcrR family transcriptional regulator [Actinokineospora auranticolor]PPK70576.1 AcrR family transcriptional regulator [Actinokineospora auranticolor]
MVERAQGPRTRARLVTAAIDLFDRDGYEETSLDAVCRRVELTKGALYRHFPSKQALAVAVVEDYLAHAHQVRGRAWAATRDPVLALVDATTELTESARTTPLVRVAVRLVITAELFDLVAGAHFLGLVAVARDLLDEAVLVGEVRPTVNTTEEAMGITAMLIGAQTLAVLMPADCDIPAHVTTDWAHRLDRVLLPRHRDRVARTAHALHHICG